MIFTVNKVESNENELFVRPNLNRLHLNPTENLQ